METTHENAVFILKSTGQDVMLKVTRSTEHIKIPTETSSQNEFSSINGLYLPKIKCVFFHGIKFQDFARKFLLLK